MSSSCLVKSLLFASAAAWSARADILPPDSHLVPRSVALVNTGDYPSQVFVALEFYPGNPAAPVAATVMGPGVEAKLSGYKLDWIRIYAAKASEWSAVKGKLGLAKSAAMAGTDALCAAPAAAGPCVCCHTDTTITPSGDWTTGLTLLPGELDAATRYAPNTSALQSEAYEYRLEGPGPEKVSAYASLQTYADGSKKEVEVQATALRAPARAVTSGSLAAEGRSLIWNPRQNGVAAIFLFDAEGKRVWSARRAVVSGQTQIMTLPAMAAGRYLVSARGRGWEQKAWLNLGNP